MLAHNRVCLCLRGACDKTIFSMRVYFHRIALQRAAAFARRLSIADVTALPQLDMYAYLRSGLTIRQCEHLRLFPVGFDRDVGIYVEAKRRDLDCMVPKPTGDAELAAIVGAPA